MGVGTLLAGAALSWLTVVALDVVSIAKAFFVCSLMGNLVATLVATLETPSSLQISSSGLHDLQ